MYVKSVLSILTDGEKFNKMVYIFVSLKLALNINGELVLKYKNNKFYLKVVRSVTWRDLFKDRWMVLWFVAGDPQTLLFEMSTLLLYYSNTRSTISLKSQNQMFAKNLQVSIR